MVVFILGAGRAFGETPESTVRRFLTLAYEGRLEELPVSETVRMERFERQVRNVLRVRCVRVDQISITLLPKSEDEVTAHAAVTIAKYDPHPRGWSAVELIPLRFELVRQGGKWLATEVRNRDEELAEQLLLVTGEERERLLRQQPERISVGLSRALYARSMAILNSGDFKAAADATAMTRRIAIESGDRGGEALALGAATYTSGDLEVAVQLSKESLSIAETTGEPDVMARAWYDHGRTFRANRFGPRPAVPNLEQIECYQKARGLAERAEDPTILVRVLYSLANIAANAQSDYLNARRYIDEGIAIAREVGDATGEMSLEMVLTTVYLAQGDQERGMFHHKRATELAEKLRALAYPTLLVRTGCMLLDEGRYDEARGVFAQAVTRDQTGRLKTATGTAPGNVIASALRCLGIIEAERGNFSEAECLVSESAQHHRGSPNVFLYELAGEYARRGKNAEALALSLASLGENGLHAGQQQTALVAAGRAYRKLGYFKEGFSAALEAIEIREALDLRIAGDERQHALASNRTSESYELAAEIALDRGDPVQALAFLERGRARVLMDILENGRPGSIAESDTAQQERQAALEREVARISMDLDRARAAGDERAVAAASERLSGVRAVHATFLDGLEARARRRHATRKQVDAAQLLGLGMRLPPRTVAVEYFVGEHDLSIFVMDKDRVIVRTKKIEREVLEERIRAFLEILARGDLRVERAARDVFSLLVAPIEGDISGADAVVIVPDDTLWRLPFAALVDGRGRFFVESKAIVYAPSMTAFSSIVDPARRRQSRPVSLFAVGNPTMDPSASKAAASFYRNATLGPLPDAEHEVDVVGGLYDPRRSLVLKREEATEARTKTALGEATVAHFATHAILDDANPMYSRLMLAHDGRGADDGWLESWEVARMDLQADLVVLSACDTARGSVGGGEGVIGLAWSFFLAGASSTLATQWKVASDTTARFMIGFHRALRATPTNPELHKAQALRNAQLQLIRDKRTRHPFHWASFVLLGDPSSGRDRRLE